MNKNSGVKSKLKNVLIAIISLLVIASVILCAIKIKRLGNEKNILGTWMPGNSEEVFTFQDNGNLFVNQDMPEVGISSGSAYYEFVYMNTIRVVQGEDSVEFEIELSKNRLTLFFIEQEYLVLQKQ